MRRAVVSIDSLRRDGGTQPRAGLNDSIVSQFTHDMRRGDKFPPVHAFEDVTGTLWLADGFHRVEAASGIGMTSLEADIERGDVHAAFEHAVREAASHHPLTLEEKRQAARRFLSESSWRGRSSRWIARLCGIDGQTVDGIRRALSAENRQIHETKENALDSSSRPTTKPAPDVMKTEPPPSASTPPRTPRAYGTKIERLLNHNGETRSVSEWARLIGVEAQTICRRLKNGESVAMALRPAANEKRQCVRKGTVYELPVKPQKKRPKRLSTKAHAMLKGTAVFDDGAQLRALAAMPPGTQVLIAGHIKSGASSTVEAARAAIMGGAPVDAWGRAYTSVMALSVDDQVRLVQQIWRSWSDTEKALVLQEYLGLAAAGCKE